MFTPFVSDIRYLTCFNPDLAKVGTPVSDVPTVAVKVFSSVKNVPPAAGSLSELALPSVTLLPRVINEPVSVILLSSSVPVVLLNLGIPLHADEP